LIGPACRIQWQRQRGEGILAALFLGLSLGMNLLSIQSHVAYGHVGNSAAVFALQRIGAEVWPIHTVQFSNHPGYGQWRGEIFDAGLITEVMRGIEERGVLGECDGVLSGYMGSAQTGEAILDSVARVKRANPSARYCCDPVIGDVGRGVYVRPGIPEFLKAQAVPAADLITPNQFELDHLTGRGSATIADALAGVDALHALGPRAILVTSLHTSETPEDAIDVLACDETGRFRVRTPRLALGVNGAGDAVAALFFAHYLRRGSIAEAASLAVSSIFGVLSRTMEAGAAELQVVTAQDELIEPSQLFEAERIAPA
jgi:pyridoxine kinase